MAVDKVQSSIDANDKLVFKRHFTKAGEDVYDNFTWSLFDSEIKNYQDGQVVFSQKGVEFPDNWSQNAVNIVSQKYFAGRLNSSTRERSLKQLVDRVVDTITNQGIAEGYFSESNGQIFSDELKYALVAQKFSFNSPVWFNIGVESRIQQASACFILAVEDSIKSILNWYTEEGLIFQGGSGSGISVSSLRSSYEPVGDSAGYASGPVSFMRGADSSAGSIKSGGKTRRAAKMVVLGVDHPDIEEFIWCKANEEKKSHALTAAGFEMGVDGRDIYSIQYQNANNSVRVNDEFMQAVVEDRSWPLKAVTTGEIIKEVSAKDIFHQIAQAAWECADPGVQFDTTINDWHTTPNKGRINASNPCSEYMHIDNSACNLASLNLLKFVDEDGHFLPEEFKQIVQLAIVAQEILVGYSKYPTERISQNARDFRQLGLGYTNLGALLMCLGLPYDSDKGRTIAAAITSLMSGQAYLTSARLAAVVGAFAGFENDKEATLAVLKKHQAAAQKIDQTELIPGLQESAEIWDKTVALAEIHGVRNSQTTVLAPTGTISFMMDSDTTGVEPDLGLVKYKVLVGGGSMKLVNNSVGRALKNLGYNRDQIEQIIGHIKEKDTIAEAPHLKEADQPVFACSIGENPISHQGHIKMMAAVQPYISGAISKTVNLPESASVEEIEELFIDSWRSGVKAVAVYRDNCKVGQPLQVSSSNLENSSGIIIKEAVRRVLPQQRNAKTFKFVVGGAKGFFTVGEFDDGTPGELFISIAKQGSTLAGIVDSLAISVSYGLQYGVPLKSYIRAFLHISFSPSGATNDPEIRRASSIIDFIVRKIASIYLSHEDQVDLNLVDPRLDAGASIQSPDQLKFEMSQQEKIKPTTNRELTGPMCVLCGNPTYRSGSCFICDVCGQTTGCG